MDFKKINPDTATTTIMTKVKETSGGRTALTTDGVKGMHQYEK